MVLMKLRIKLKIILYIGQKNKICFLSGGIKEERIIFPDYCRNRTLDDFSDEVNINLNEVTNLINSAQKLNYGYVEKFVNDARLKSTSPYIDDNITDAEGYVATSAIPIDVKQCNSLTIYISGGDFTESFNCGIHMILKSTDLREVYGTELNGSLLENNDFKLDFTLVKIHNGYYKLVCNDYDDLKSKCGNKTIYIAFSLKGYGEDLVISVNEEILL